MRASRTRSRIVTGAASGIGKEIAIVFAARRRARSVIADLNQDAADATAAEHRGQRAARPSASPWTSPTRPQVERRRRRGGRQAFGGVDILVSNAGIQIVEPLDEFAFANWKKLLAIHLDGAFLTTAPACAHVRRGKRRQRHLHGLGALQGGLDAQGALRHRQARPDRPRQGGGQGRRRARRARQRDLPRLRAHAAGRQADPRAGQGARHLRGAR